VLPVSPRRFVAQAARVRRPGWLVFGSLVPVAAVVTVLGLLVPGAKGAMGAVVIGGAVASMAVVVWGLLPRPLAMDVWPDRITVEGPRRGSFSLTGFTLGPWTMPGYGVSMGTVLHLGVAAAPFRIGGRDHRPSPGHRLDAPGTSTVDATLSAADFDSLLAKLPAFQPPDRGYREGEPPDFVRWALTPNYASARGVVRVMGPWMATIATCVLVSWAFDALGFYDTPWGQSVAFGTTLAVVVGGLVLTVVLSRRKPRAAIAMESSGDELRLVEVPSGRVLAAAPLSQVRVSRGHHGAGGRGTLYWPTITVAIPGADAVTFSVPDARFGWTDATPSTGAGSYLVGTPEWITANERLGTRGMMKSGPG
jgi:hypothetical protein